MDIRTLSPTYAVSPQIAPGDCAAIKEAGFTTIICNRPDEEIPRDVCASVMQAAAEAAGLEFVILPITHHTLNPENVQAQRVALDSSTGPVLAYCASGTRSSIIWSLGQAGDLPTSDIIEATTKAGYDLRGLAPQLDDLAERRKS